MAKVRFVSIRNFRGIKSLDWAPAEGLNCLVGPGDAGKTSILDALELCLGARRSTPLDESDLHGHDVSNPCVVDVTIGGLEDGLRDLHVYAEYLRGFDPASRTIHDEPDPELDDVLTVRVEIGDDLIPRWRLLSDRTAGSDPRDLSFADRGRIAPTRLGAFAAAHLAWGQRSVLNRLVEERPDAAAALATARRAARTSFTGGVGEVFTAAVDAVDGIAQKFAVNIGKPQVLLDAGQVGVGTGMVALHDESGIPLRTLGLGSSRLLVAGFQQAASGGGTALIDEVEHGLEPFRIIQLLRLLGAKVTTAPQTFLTTHSPVVIREVSAHQVWVIRRPRTKGGEHLVIAAGGLEARQKTLRACAESFVNPRVLVCEGKTELGLMRGREIASLEAGRVTLAYHGVGLADGGGAEGPARALAFAELGYDTALLRDDDVSLPPGVRLGLEAAGVRIFEWTDRQMFEAALFRASPADGIGPLLDIASDTRSAASVDGDIVAASSGAHSMDSCRGNPGDPAIRELLAKASTRKDGKGNRRNWFKLVEPGERIYLEVVRQFWAGFDPTFSGVLAAVIAWGRRESPTDGP